MPTEPVAAPQSDAHTRSMGVLLNRRFLTAAIGAISLATTATPVAGDEIRLKDGKKLYGVIVSYEENMFKVKTDFGYVLVEKDKIASIIPSAPASTETQPATKNSAESAKGKPGAQTKPATAIASVTDPAPSTTNASVKLHTPNANNQNKMHNTVGKIAAIPAKPGRQATA